MNTFVNAAVAAALVVPAGVLAGDNPTGPPPSVPSSEATAAVSPTAAPAPEPAAEPGGGTTATPAPPATTAGVGRRSGLPFDAGVFAHDAVVTAGQLGRVGEYEKVTGRPVDLWGIAPQREQGFAGLLAETDRIAGIVPEGVQVDWAFPLVSRAEGAQLGKALCKASPNAYIRPGWEFNLYQGWPWITQTIGNDKFIEGYRDTISGIRETCPGIQSVWNPNTGQGGVSRAMEAWPGPEFVDIIGVDAYDWANEDPIKGPGQLDEWAAHARSLGKGIALPEWAVHGVQGRGDNPAFVDDVVEWAKRNADILRYWSYFDETADYIKSSVGQMPKTGEALNKGMAELAAAGGATSPVPSPAATATPAPTGAVSPAPYVPQPASAVDAARLMLLWLWQPSQPEVLQAFRVEVTESGEVRVVPQDQGVVPPVVAEPSSPVAPTDVPDPTSTASAVPVEPTETAAPAPAETDGGVGGDVEDEGGDTR